MFSRIWPLVLIIRNRLDFSLCESPYVLYDYSCISLPFDAQCIECCECECCIDACLYVYLSALKRERVAVYHGVVSAQVVDYHCQAKYCCSQVVAEAAILIPRKHDGLQSSLRCDPGGNDTWCNDGSRNAGTNDWWPSRDDERW